MAPGSWLSLHDICFIVDDIDLIQCELVSLLANTTDSVLSTSIKKETSSPSREQNNRALVQVELTICRSAAAGVATGARCTNNRALARKVQ